MANWVYFKQCFAIKHDVNFFCFYVSFSLTVLLLCPNSLICRFHKEHFKVLCLNYACACTCNPRFSVLEIMISIRVAGLVQWKEHWLLVVVQSRQSSNSRIIHHHICVMRQELTKIDPLLMPGKCFHFCFCLIDMYSTLSYILTDHCIKACSQY